MPFLELDHVSKGYGVKGARTEVLRDIHLTLARGEFVAIVGCSGAGKTTLLSLIAGLLHPDKGRLTLDGLEITAPGPDRGVVFQNYSLLPWLTVSENIHLAVDQVFPRWPATQKRQHVERHIEMVHLTAARYRRPGELSGGMRQRVSLARALATDPQILLLDEPLSALDALTRATLQDELARIAQETQKTVVLITNDVEEGLLLADRLVLLTAGPGATLGASFDVDFPRPRSLKALNHDPRYKALRQRVMSQLLVANSKKNVNVFRELTLPHIKPEDRSQPRVGFGGWARKALRRGITSEPVESRR
jgi:nitrate/nitrite transport system ATP-binding protein